MKRTPTLIRLTLAKDLWWRVKKLPVKARAIGKSNRTAGGVIEILTASLPPIDHSARIRYRRIPDRPTLKTMKEPLADFRLAAEHALFPANLLLVPICIAQPAPSDFITVIPTLTTRTLLVQPVLPSAPPGFGKTFGLLEQIRCPLLTHTWAILVNNKSYFTRLK